VCKQHNYGDVSTFAVRLGRVHTVYVAKYTYSYTFGLHFNLLYCTL